MGRGSSGKDWRVRWAWLPIRLDRLPALHTSFQLGHQLDLPGSPSDVLAALSANRRILLIDQLDAISATSGRQGELYDAVAELLREVQAHEGVQVVIACRKFDYESDDRLRALLRRQNTVPIDLPPLSPESVHEAIAQLGLDISRLRVEHLTLFSSPLHLYLLARISEDTRARAFDFTTEAQLYDLFWDRKWKDVRERLGYEPRWTDVVDALCADMSANRRLWAAPEVVDAFRATADAMTSEQVLVVDGARVALFHDSFFDYAFARRFSQLHLQGLVDFLLSEDQELFRRAQVRAILTYERQHDPEHYATDLGNLLADTRIRFHLKHSIALFLESLDEPRDVEWERMRPLIEAGPNPISDRLVRMLRNSPAWLEFVYANRWLATQLAGNDAAATRALNVMILLQRHRPDRVAELLEPYVGHGGPWKNRLRLVGFGELGTDRRYFELVLRLIDDGTLDDRPIGPFGRDIWDLGHALPGLKPAWACELAAHEFRRRAAVAQATGESNPFDSGAIADANAGPDFLVKASEKAPQAFVTHLLPVMLDLMAANPGPRPLGRLVRDTIWQYRLPGKAFGMSATLLKAMERAVRAIAADSSFSSVATDLGASKLETASYLLACGFAGAGRERADQAIEFLLEMPERLELSADGNRGTAASEVLRVATPAASIKHLSQLVALVVTYDDRARHSQYDERLHDLLRFRLLSAIAPRGRGKLGREKLAELQNLFGVPAPAISTAEAHAGSVEPPVPETVTSTFTNEQWLTAMAAHGPEMRWADDGRVLGGSGELAYVFESAFAGDPSRFARLVAELPGEVHLDYFAAGLRAATTNIDKLSDEDVWAVCRRCDRLAGRPAGRWLAWTIQAAAGRVIPADVVSMLVWYAIESAEPTDHPSYQQLEAHEDDGLFDASVSSEHRFRLASAAMWVGVVAGRILGVIRGRHPESMEPSQERSNKVSEEYFGGSLLQTGINTTRGAAAEAVASILEYHPDQLEMLMPAIRSLVAAPASVRAVAARILSVIFRRDTDLAVHLFDTLADGDERLLGSSYVVRFLFAAVHRRYEAVEQTLLKMAMSRQKTVGHAAGQLLALRALLVESSALESKVLAGSAAVRRGAAGTYAANVGIPYYSARCTDVLSTLFSDPDEAVREAAAACFQQLSPDGLATNDALCLAFVRSPAFTTVHHLLLQRLSESAGAPLSVIVEAAESFIAGAGLAAGNIRTHAAAQSPEVSVLLVRAYSQNPPPELRTRALDALDRMLEAGAFGVEESLESYQR